MSTPPPAPKLRPPSDPIKPTVSWDDLERLDRARHELEHARLMLMLALQFAGSHEREQRAILLDAAASTFKPALAEVSRVIRALYIRFRVERERRGREQASRTTALAERPRVHQRKFHDQAHRK